MEPSKRKKLVEAAIAGHIWINSQETKRLRENEDIESLEFTDYKQPFAEFLES
jgi:hypothetical protein